MMLITRTRDFASGLAIGGKSGAAPPAPVAFVRQTLYLQ